MIATLLAALLATPSTPMALPEACQARLTDYGRPLTPVEQDWLYAAALRNGGRMVYFGAEHSRDPAAPQVAALTLDFAQTRPTAVFFEGRERGVGATAAESVQAFGEPGLVRFLAAQAGVEARSLEPDPADEAKAMLARFPADQVFLFYALRQATQLRERQGMTEEALDAAVGKLLARMGAMGDALGFSPPFSTLEGLEAAYARYWPGGGTWRDAPMTWFNPRLTSSQTGGVFTNEINAASSRFRDLHMAATVSAAARSGERVFAVVGRDHVAAQRAALDCALGEAP